MEDSDASGARRAELADHLHESVDDPGVELRAGVVDQLGQRCGDGHRTFVVYETSLGKVAVPVGAFAPGSSWEPSPIFHTGAALATAIANGNVNVALRFTSTNGGARIDDVFLDPRHR